MLKKLVLSSVVSGILLSASSYAEEMPVPYKLQSALILKILSYDRSLKGDVKIGILFSSSPASISGKNEIISSFSSLTGEKIGSFGFSTIPVSINDISSLKSKNIDVLYVTNDNTANISKISRETREAGILSLTGVPEYVENGSISVGIGLKENKKPEIIVNLSASKAEGHDLSAQLLKLAKVIK